MKCSYFSVFVAVKILSLIFVYLFEIYYLKSRVWTYCTFLCSYFRRFNAIVSQLWFWPFWVKFLNLWLKVVHIDQWQKLNWPLADNFEATNVTFFQKKNWHQMCNLLVYITQNGQNQSCDTIALKRRSVYSTFLCTLFSNLWHLCGRFGCAVVVWR